MIQGPIAVVLSYEGFFSFCFSVKPDWERWYMRTLTSARACPAGFGRYKRRFGRKHTYWLLVAVVRAVSPCSQPASIGSLACLAVWVLPFDQLLSLASAPNH